MPAAYQACARHNANPAETIRVTGNAKLLEHPHGEAWHCRKCVARRGAQRAMRHLRRADRLLPSPDALEFHRRVPGRFACGGKFRRHAPRIVEVTFSFLLGRWTPRVEDGSECDDETFPAGLTGGQLFSSGGSQPVEFRFSIGCGNTPISLDPTFLLEPLQSGIERAVIDFECVVRGMFDEFCDAVAVFRAPAQGAKDQEVQCSLEQVEAFAGL